MTAGQHIGVSLVELSGRNPGAWNYHGGDVFTAGSTYKLPALMAEDQRIAAGSVSPSGQVCFTDADFEAGWFTDYQDGACFSRQELASRAGIQSDNTAGHMLVHDIGGASALDQYARSWGATSSEFFDPNTTTSNDLASLLDTEVNGQAGGATAQAWLYPLLTNTEQESGIPAGIPSGNTVVHKTGYIDNVTDDAAIVMRGATPRYILAVTLDGVGGDGGWAVVAQVSKLVWQYEAARS